MRPIIAARIGDGGQDGLDEALTYLVRTSGLAPRGFPQRALLGQLVGQGERMFHAMSNGGAAFAQEALQVSSR